MSGNLSYAPRIRQRFSSHAWMVLKTLVFWLWETTNMSSSKQRRISTEYQQITDRIEQVNKETDRTLRRKGHLQEIGNVKSEHNQTSRDERKENEKKKMVSPTDENICRN